MGTKSMRGQCMKPQPRELELNDISLYKLGIEFFEALFIILCLMVVKH